MLLPELNKSIDEYKTEKWGVSFKEYDNSSPYTEKDIDEYNKPEKNTFRGYGLKYRMEDL